MVSQEDLVAHRNIRPAIKSLRTIIEKYYPINRKQGIPIPDHIKQLITALNHAKDVAETIREHYGDGYD